MDKRKWSGEPSTMIVRGIPKDLRKAFKSAAAENEETMTQALQGLMATYVQRFKEGEARK